MSNSPLETKSFRHYLLFESLGKTDLYQIKEPDGFDAVAPTLKQNTNRFSRDSFFIASENKALRFYHCKGKKGISPQVVDPTGRISKYLDHGLHWILESDRLFGFESKIKYILEEDGVFLDGFYLSCVAKDSDGYTFFGANGVQSNKIANYKKQESTKIDLYSAKNFKNETITPATKMRFLRKAFPFSYQTKWLVQNSRLILAGTGSYFNLAQDIEGEGKIRNSLIPLDQLLASSYEDSVNAFNYVAAINDLTNVNIHFDLDIDFFYRTGGPQPELGDASIKLIAICHPDPFAFVPGSPPTFNQLWTRDLYYLRIAGADAQNVHLPATIDSQLPDIPRDYRLSVLWQITWTESNLGETADSGADGFQLIRNLTIFGNAGAALFSYFDVASGTVLNTRTSWGVKDQSFTLSATETAINSVITGVRYIDGMRQCSKFIEDVPVNAPRWDAGGEFYDQVLWNRAGVTSNSNLPFITSYKDCLGSVEEVCGDYENKEDEIFVGQFEDYYTNDEIGVLTIKPNSEYKKSWNERTMLKSIKLGYETYQQDSNLDQNTKEDAHTEAEWITPNEMALNNLDRKFKFIRSGFSQQKLVDLEFKKPTTADSTDDSVCISDLVQLPSGSFNTFGKRVLMRVVSGLLQVLNRASNDDEEDVVINWLSIGVNVGDFFYITAGANAETYTVAEISRTVLKLRPTNGFPVFEGDFYIEVKYFYTGILYATRTNEGFSLITGISNPNSYPGLFFSIRHLFNYWGSIINTACSFSVQKVIRNSYFKSNGLLTTRLLPTDPIYVENETIDVSTLRPKLITPDIETLECICSYQQMIEILNAYKTKRGFIRAFDVKGNVIKGYIQNFENLIASRSLTLQLERKFESDTLILTFANGMLSVNDTNYPVGISNWYVLENGRFQAYDSKHRPICSYTLWSKVSLNGTIHTSLLNLEIALNNL